MSSSLRSDIWPAKLAISGWINLVPSGCSISNPWLPSNRINTMLERIILSQVKIWKCASVHLSMDHVTWFPSVIFSKHTAFANTTSSKKFFNCFSLQFPIPSWELLTSICYVFHSNHRLDALNWTPRDHRQVHVGISRQVFQHLNNNMFTLIWTSLFDLCGRFRRILVMLSNGCERTQP